MSAPQRAQTPGIDHNDRFAGIEFQQLEIPRALTGIICSATPKSGTWPGLQIKNSDLILIIMQFCWLLSKRATCSKVQLTLVPCSKTCVNQLAHTHYDIVSLSVTRNERNERETMFVTMKYVARARFTHRMRLKLLSITIFDIKNIYRKLHRTSFCT